MRHAGLTAVMRCGRVWGGGWKLVGSSWKSSLKIAKATKITTAFISLAGGVNHPPPTPPSLQNHSIQRRFTRCLLWALIVVHLKRRLGIIQWRHAAPFSHRKNKSWLMQITTVPHVDHYQRPMQGLLKIQCALRLGLWSKAKGKCFLIKALQKQKPQCLNSENHRQPKEPDGFCLYLLKGKTKLNSKGIK